MYTRGILETTTLWSSVNLLVHSMVISGAGGIYIHILWTDGYGHEHMLTVADSTSMPTEIVHMDVSVTLCLALRMYFLSSNCTLLFYRKID